MGAVSEVAGSTRQDRGAHSHRRTTRAEQKALTRERLLEAAARVFARRGFAGVSVEEIADEAGFSKGAVYSNFATKDELFLTLFDERTSQKLALVDDVFQGAEDLGSRARGGAARLSNVIERNRDWCLLFMEFWTYAVRTPDLRRKFADHYEALRERVAMVVEVQAAELGVELAIPALDVAAGLIALGEGLVLQKLTDPDRFKGDLGASLLALFFAGAINGGEANAQ